MSKKTTKIVALSVAILMVLSIVFSLVAVFL